MKHQPEFIWDDLNKVALCVIYDGQNTYYGQARCHEKDMDMCSEKTGCEIAFRRARIKYLQYYRDTLKTQIKALNQLYYSMKHSKKFNPKSYENKMLQRQIRLTNLDLDTVKEMLTTEQQELKAYLDKKDIFYNRIRNKRNPGAD